MIGVSAVVGVADTMVGMILLVEVMVALLVEVMVASLVEVMVALLVSMIDAVTSMSMLGTVRVMVPVSYILVGVGPNLLVGVGPNILVGVGPNMTVSNAVGSIGRGCVVIAPSNSASAVCSSIDS
jgi:hypothetical protein